MKHLVLLIMIVRPTWTTGIILKRANINKMPYSYAYK